MTKREGLLQRLMQALGRSSTRMPYEGCWACSMGRHGLQDDRTCTCCRNNHPAAFLPRQI